MIRKYRNKVMCHHNVVDIESMGENDIIKQELGYGYRGKCTLCKKPIRAKKLAEYVIL